ncbi:polyketide synthase [Streptomyces sp. NPDC047821]|uniref:beta-ketoacyl [acyl carrier protein] synthase domain-containing protein n=1 Tax=Streptomyces sp. NPDC047821 TaxID=3365488 RepID=UPI0037166F3B
MDERDILTRFKAGTLERGLAVQLLAELEAAPQRPAPRPAPEPAAAGEPATARVPETTDRYAVVGIAGRYPLAPDLRAYWQNLREGRDTSSDAPLGRPGRSPLGAGERGHFLDGATEFDPDFFGLTAESAALMDPQERLFLETAWEALEDAGCTGARLDALTGPGGAPRGVGVFVGVSAADYALVAAENWARGGRRMPASGHWRTAGRLSALLGLNGPAHAVDAAEASALVAVHLAVGALRRGECAAAVAGGVELLLHPSRGRRGAGEGVGAVVLKPLARALADGDHVHAVVRSTSAGAPGGAEAAGLRETAGTTARRVGDAGAATGLAALTAAVLQLRHGTLAPAQDGAPATPWPRPRDARGRELPRVATVEVAGPEGARLGARAVLEEFVPARRTDAGHGDGPDAGHGDGPDAPRGDGRADGHGDGPGGATGELILLSAPTPAHLAASAARLADWLAADSAGSGDDTAADGDRAPLADVARALRAGRAARPCRMALTAHDVPHLVEVLRDFADGGAHPADGVRCVDLRAGDADPLGLGEAPETRDYLAALWRAGRTEQLTRLWLSGLDVDWAALEHRSGDGAPAPLVPLPPSAFLRRPLWLGHPDGTEGTETAG